MGLEWDDNLGGASETVSLRDKLTAEIHQLAKRQLINAPQAKAFIEKQSHLLGHQWTDQQLIQQLGSYQLSEVSFQKMEHFVKTRVQEIESVLKDDSVFAKMSVKYATPFQMHPEPKSVKSGDKQFLSGLERDKAQELLKEVSLFAHKHKLDDKQESALFAIVGVGGKNAEHLLDDKRALYDFFDSVKNKLEQKPEVTDAFQDKLQLDDKGRVFLRDDPSVTPKPKPEKSKGGEKGKFDELQQSDNKKMLEKNSLQTKNSPKPSPEPQVDRAEEALRAIWGGGRVPNHGGQVFLGMGHISKFQEELGNGVVKFNTRDQVEQRNDLLNSSKLPGFGNELEQDQEARQENSKTPTPFDMKPEPKGK